MHRFLTLCEQFDPQNTNDPKWELFEFLKMKGVDVSVNPNSEEIIINLGHKQIPINVSQNEEEAESIDAGYGDYDVNKEVEGLAGKAASGLKGVGAKLFGTSAQQAKQAVTQRQAVAKQAVGAYRRKTQKLQQDLRNVQ